MMESATVSCPTPCPSRMPPVIQRDTRYSAWLFKSVSLVTIDGVATLVGSRVHAVTRSCEIVLLIANGPPLINNPLRSNKDIAELTAKLAPFGTPPD